jgi:ribosomal protein L37AE/L43A
VKWFERPPFNLCAQCGAALIAPIWAEHVNDRHVRNLWSCEACGYQFETSAYFPTTSEARGQAQAHRTDTRPH